MINFIINNWITVLYIAIALCVVGYLIYRRKWDTLRKLVYKAILEAENAIKGSKQGIRKLNYVIEAIYGTFVPPWMRIFITRERFRSAIQNWFDEIKNLLEYTPNKEISPTVTGAVAQEPEGVDQC